MRFLRSKAGVIHGDLERNCTLVILQIEFQTVETNSGDIWKGGGGKSNDIYRVFNYGQRGKGMSEDL
jgi:hypothetical protein